MIENVTLIMAETRVRELATATFDDAISRVTFGSTIFYGVPAIQDYANKIDFGRFYYTKAALPIGTSHALLMEWDAGINDPTMWSDEFLVYDYIGAPWRWLPTGRNVGNGGFALVSYRLIKFIESRYPHIATDVDLCQRHRADIEAHGFKWAPPDVAARFSFEGWDNGPPQRAERSFGFHGLYNWPTVLPRDELVRRARLVRANPFLRKQRRINQLYATAPWLIRELEL